MNTAELDLRTAYPVSDTEHLEPLARDAAARMRSYRSGNPEATHVYCIFDDASGTLTDINAVSPYAPCFEETTRGILSVAEADLTPEGPVFKDLSALPPRIGKLAQLIERRYGEEAA